MKFIFAFLIFVSVGFGQSFPAAINRSSTVTSATSSASVSSSNAVTYGQSGGQPVYGSGTGSPTTPFLTASNVRSYTTPIVQFVGNSNATISGSANRVYLTGTISLNRNYTLPAITTGTVQSFVFSDLVGGVVSPWSITLGPTPPIGGSGIFIPNQTVRFFTDGTSMNWYREKLDANSLPGIGVDTTGVWTFAQTIGGTTSGNASSSDGAKARSALQGITTPNVLFTSPVSITSNTAALAFVSTFTPNQLLYSTATNNLGFLAIGSGLSLSSGTLSASATSLTGTGGISIASGTASLVTGSNGYFPGTLRQWSTNGTRGKTIAICGDSTSESITGASAIYNELSRYQVAGGLLDGVTVTAYGRTGMTAAAAISDTNAAGFLQCVASQPNVIVISFDINDGRVGATYASMLASNIALVNYIETNSPATDIVWRLPNVFTSDDVGGNGFVTPNSSAQAYCNAIRSAGLALANIWPNLTILDESPIFGTVCLSSSSWPLSAYMSNQLHPSQAGYQLIGDAIANLLGQKQAASTFSPNVATTLRATLYQDYWTYFPAVQDPNYYDVVFSAPVNALNTSLGIQVGINADGNYAGIKAKMLAIGYDVFQINKQPPILLQSVNFNTSSQFYLNQSAAISSIVASGTANALVTTSVTHYLTNQEPVAIISNTGSSPVVSGTYTATVTSGSTFLISVANLSGTGTGGVVRPVALPQTSPAVSGSSINQPYGTITFYRSKYGNDSTIQQYWIDEATYPYRWRGVTVSAGNSSVWTAGGVFVDSLPQELPGINRTATKVGDTLIVQGKGAFAINAIGSSSPWYGAGQKITTSSTDTSAFGGLPFAIVSGSHGYENGTSRRNTSYPYHFLQIDDAITGNMLVSGTVTASGYVGPGVGLTGTAAALTAGIANGVTGTNSGSFGFSGSNGIIGTTGTATVTPGSVGEIVSSVVSGTSVSLSGGTPANITSISLTAGDWDVSGVVSFSGTNATITGEIANSGTSSATLITDGYEAYSGALTTLATDTDSVTLSRRRYSLPTTTTVYLVGYVNFSAGTVVGFGNITARRMR